MLKVGIIDYINTYPLLGGFLTGNVEAEVRFISGVPSVLNRLLREGKSDLSFVSTLEYLNHRERYTLLPGYCIAGNHKLRSVNLYTKHPLSELDEKRIALTSDSQASVALLKLLCHHYWKVSPEFVSGVEDPSASQHEAFLLIGDQALKRDRFPGYITVDLAQAWYYATGLPFVFAVLAARNETIEHAGDEVLEFMERLQLSFQWSQENRDQMILMGKKKLGADRECVALYFERLVVELGQSERRGIALFNHLYQTIVHPPTEMAKERS
jgi:chorismate dehydratase